MSYAPHRSMSAELSEGMTDSKYKKVIQDRGGFVEDKEANRTVRDLSDMWYGGIYEEKDKIRPDGEIVRTPNYVATPKPLCH